MIKDYKLPQRTIHGDGCEECGSKQNVRPCHADRLCLMLQSTMLLGYSMQE